MEDLNGWLKRIEESLMELRVSNITAAPTLAQSIVRNMEEGKHVVLSCIGAQAIAQAVKAVAIGNGEVAQQGCLLVMMPAFRLKKFPDRVTGEEVEVTAVRLTVIKLPACV